MTSTDMSAAPTRRFPTASPDGLIAAILLAFLATAGLFYVNIMAAIVDGLVGSMGITDAQAGRIGSANIYGAAIGALTAALLIKRIAWRPAAAVALVTLIAIDLVSILVTSPDVLLVVRLGHGMVGGLLVGLAFSVIARTRAPDRTFGVMLFVQFGLGGLGVMTLPRLAPIFGSQVLFLALAAFSLVTLAMVPFLADYRSEDTKTRATDGGVKWGPLALTLVAIFAFQAANMGLLAYIIRLGISYGLERNYVSTALGAATWVALIGPLLVATVGARFGRFRLMFAAMLLTLAGTAVFHASASPLAYLIANCGTGITWGFVIAFLFGMTAEFDRTGRTAAIGGFVSKLGLASGPVIAGSMLAAGQGFGSLINMALIGLAASALFMLVPAFALDRAARRAVTETTVIESKETPS